MCNAKPVVVLYIGVTDAILVRFAYTVHCLRKSKEEGSVGSTHVCVCGSSVASQ